jgi:hypothetical protein
MSEQERIPKLSVLRINSSNARAAIVAKCRRGIVHPGDNEAVCAWGQYLEIRGHPVQQPLSNQYGIYGTSAAVQMLAMHGGNRNLVLSGSRVLPLVLSDPDGINASLHDRFVRKQDLLVIFKLASLLDAANCLEEFGVPEGHHVDKPALVRSLLALRRQSEGWPDYKSDHEWQGSNTHATAVAVLALSKRDMMPEALSACREAFEWFYNDEPLAKQSVATLSMLTMAMASPSLGMKAKRKGSIPGNIVALQKECERLVCDWIGNNAPTEVQRSLDGTEYWLPPNSTTERNADGGRFTFLLYLPHILVSLAVFSSPRLRSTYAARRFVLAVVHRVTREINQQGCFIAAGRSMVSTVEHLWLYRLLHEFETKGLYDHEIVLIIDHIRLFARRRWPTTALALLLVLALAVASGLTRGSMQVALGAISATIAAVVTTIVTAFLVKTWWGE